MIKKLTHKHGLNQMVEIIECQLPVLNLLSITSLISSCGSEWGNLIDKDCILELIKEAVKSIPSAAIFYIDNYIDEKANNYKRNFYIVNRNSIIGVENLFSASLKYS